MESGTPETDVLPTDPKDVTLEYLQRPVIISAGCVADAIDDLDSNVEIIDGDRFWKTAFPEPVATVPLSQFFGDTNVGQRILPLDLDYLVTVSAYSRKEGHQEVGLPFALYADHTKKVAVVSATLWNLRSGSKVASTSARGVGKQAEGFVGVAPWKFVPYGLESGTCKNVAQALAKSFVNTRGNETSRIVVLGTLGTGSVNIHVKGGDPVIKSLASRAEAGDRDALYKLAAQLEVDRHLREAGLGLEDWVLETQYRLGVHSGGFYGTGLATSEQWVWLCMGAHGGHSLAQERMGDHYWDGKAPVEQDRRRGYMWYGIRALNGSQEAADKLDQVRSALTTKDITEAERLVAVWKPDPRACKL